MKKLFLIALAVAGVTFTSCQKNVDPVEVEGKTPISLGADITTMGAQSSATKIAGTTFPNNLTNAFAITSYKGGIPTSFAGAYFDNAAVNSDASAKLTFASAEYFPSDAAKLYFYAFAPAGPQVTYTSGTSTEAPKAAYTVTGKEDIMWSKEETGLGKDDAATPVKFTFQHLLKQVSFTVKGTPAYVALDKKLQSLKISNVKNKAVLNPITGALAFDATSVVSLTAHSGTMIDITETTSAKFGAIMFEPGATFSIEVGATNTPENLRGVVDLSNLTAQGSAGYSYTVNLTLDVTGNKILINAEITEWLDGGSTELPLM